MPRDPRPLPPEVLYPRRLAARALALALEGFDLGSVSRRFSADDPAECLPGPDGDDFVFGDIRDRWEPIATVYLDGTTARVVIPDIDRIIRPNHRGEFEPEEVGIFPAAGRADVDVTVDLSSVIESDGDLLRTAPQRVSALSPSSYSHPNVIRSVRGDR